MSKSRNTIENKSNRYFDVNRDYLIECHASMFDYEGLPDSVNVYFLERFLQLAGLVVWLKDKRGDIIAIKGTRAGDLDVYGLGRDVIAITQNGESYNRVDGKDCVVGYNRLSMTPSTDILTDADTMSEINTSIDFLIFWTRISPLIRVSDEKLKLQVEAAFKSIKRGVPLTIASKKILSDFGIDDNITVENLTQPDFADKMQYTSKLYDDVVRWHFTKYGQAIHGDGKAAQVSVDEANSTVSQSLILPLSMLKARRMMIDKVNEMFDLNISVNLSGAWRAEVTEYENETGEASIDDAAQADGDGAPINDDVLVRNSQTEEEEEEKE